MNSPYLSRTTTFLILTVTLGHVPATASNTPPIAEAVRTEALKSNNDPGGRPLPFVSVWSPFRSCYKFSPNQWQLDLIDQGYPIMPWINAYLTDDDPTVQSTFGPFFSTLDSWNMPIVLLWGSQLEQPWVRDPAYIDGPIEDTGLGQNLDGSRMSSTSPMSPDKAWGDLARYYTSDESVQAYQAYYPDPPLIIWVDNNEFSHLSWTQAEKEKRYVELYGEGTTDSTKRQVWFDGWISKWNAFHAGVRAGLTDADWRNNIVFHAYNNFAPDQFGKSRTWQGTWENTNGDKTELAWQFQVYDGGLPESYDNSWESTKTAFRLWSVQTEMMNMEFAKEEAWTINPEMWYSTIFWDGGTWYLDNSKSAIYANNTEGYSATLYGGWVKYVMWLNTPRHLWHYVDYPQGDPNGDGLCTGADFTSGQASIDVWYPHFVPLLEAARDLYGDSTLEKFWRLGELVKNTDMFHPFNFEVPAAWEGVDRWYHLSTNYDPAFPVDPSSGAVDINSLNTLELPVYTLARRIGTAPNREWLIYAHAPKGARENVQIKIPGYCAIEMPQVDVGGTFQHVVEGDGSCLSAVGSSGLRLHYTFDDIQVGNANREVIDHSGNNFHGDWVTPLGEIVPGVVGEGILVTGAGDDNIAVWRDPRNTFNLEELMRDGGAISYWIKAVGLDTSAGRGRVVTTSGGWGPDGYDAYHNQNNHNTLYVQNDGNLETLRSVPLVRDEKWHHVVHVLEGEKTWSAYYDGVLRTTGGPVEDFPGADKHGIRIVAGPNAPIDDLRLYDYALSAAEVQAIYSTTLTASNSPDCFDGEDNDGDGLVDHPNDPGCDNAYDNSEGAALPAPSNLRLQ